MGEVFTGEQMTASRELACDVCVIGSGAGGAVIAAKLAEAGHSVVVLEEGGEFTRADWIALREDVSYPLMYQERGGRATTDRAITLLQGRALGGSTVVNWTTALRVSERTTRHWQEAHGLETWGQDALAPHFEAVERRLNVAPWPLSLANENNMALHRGCESLGWEVRNLPRNVRDCANTGYCGLGCPTDAKQSMHRTYIQDALAAGAIVHVDCKAERLEVEGGRVVAVHANILDRKSGRGGPVRVTVRPSVTVCAAGAVNGPALLLRSGIKAGGVGTRTWLHPVVAVVGEYAHDVHGWYGAPQSVSSHEFIDRGAAAGFFMEAAPVHPMLSSIASMGFGEDQAAFLERLVRSSVLIALQQDGMLGDPGGTVGIDRAGNPTLSYPFHTTLMEGFQAAYVALSKVHLGAGAQRAMTLHRTPVVMDGPAGLPALADASYGPLEHRVFSAHAMGGCVMGNDPATSVVGQDLRHHAVRNLFVMDGSVFPTSLGVNPTITIAAGVHKSAAGVLAAL